MMFWKEENISNHSDYQKFCSTVHIEVLAKLLFFNFWKLYMLIYLFFTQDGRYIKGPR